MGAMVKAGVMALLGRKAPTLPPFGPPRSELMRVLPSAADE
jgi:hypothetical protein